MHTVTPLPTPPPLSPGVTIQAEEKGPVTPLEKISTAGGPVTPPPLSVLPKQDKVLTSGGPTPIQGSTIPIGPVEPDTLILDYYYDDPAVVALHGPLVIPPFPANTPDFTVVGWTDKPAVLPGTPAYQSAQVYGAVATTLAYIMNLKSVPKPYITNWSETYNLVAIPRAGNQLNAYYDRSSLRFFWGKDPKTKAVVYACDAVGIVAHELGHAILDAMRPDLWNTAILEFFTFHEAFGDIIGTASVLQHPEVINQMLKETTSNKGGIPDLWQTNVASRLARQLGHAIFYTSDMSIGAEKYLRNIYNDFKYVNPLTLAMTEKNDSTLTQEPHNFSRVFSGAWYECFCELFKIYYIETNPIDSVRRVLDFMMHALLNAAVEAPNQLQFLPTVATTMIQIVEKAGNQKEAEIFKKVFKNRNLLNDGTTTRIISTIDVNPTLPPHSMYANIGASPSSKPQVVQVQLPKFVLLKNNEDLNKTLTISVSNFLNYATEQGLVGYVDDNNMFAITSDGQFQRNFICSSFRSVPQLSTAQTPSQMSIGK